MSGGDGKQFCCEDMKEGWLSSCILEIDEEDLTHPEYHQNFMYHNDMDYKTVKIGELYLYDDEMSQIEGEPFKFCPWCGSNEMVWER